MKLARSALLLMATVAGLGACDHGDHSSPIAPDPIKASLTGRWIGALAYQFGGPICLGDWTRVVLNLQATGENELVTNNGRHFPVEDSVRSAHEG